MASITIGSDASFTYPLASDNVFGPPADFALPITKYYVLSYGGYSYVELYWSGGPGSPVDQRQRFDWSPTLGGFGPGNPGRFTEIFSEGISFRATQGVSFTTSPGGQSNLTRFDQPNLAASLLWGADTITNLSATGALLTSYAGADTIVGGTGDDTLDGGAGADSLAGGQGDDLYYVDVADLVVELAGGGFDTVMTGATYIAPAAAHIERIVTMGTANVAITGNSHAIEIIGNAGVNTLDDGGGASTLTGGGGVDIYLVRNAATQVVELAGEGYDTVRTDLASYTLGANLEVLTRLGAADFQGTGNGLANVLLGGAGSDTLNGVGGNDVLTGGLGADRFVFDGLASGVDRITDFASGQDVIGLDAAGFGLASLAGVSLVVGAAAAVAGQAALRYYSNGALAFDANGGGAADAVLFAMIDGHASLAISDFALV
ncbi:hypothetical protein BH10PSE3_BH10PSE3_35930 [soil metagenome]